MVTFDDNEKSKIIGIGNIRITPTTFIENILLVDGLKHNLLSISQFCDKGYVVTFESSMCLVSSTNNSGVIFTGHRHENVYLVDLDQILMKNMDCLVAMKTKNSEAS